MSGDDPGRGARGGSTIVRPKPGRAHAPAVVRQPRNATKTRVDLVGSGLDPLVHAALPLLVLAGRLRHSREPGDLRVLHGRVVDSVRSFDQRARAAGIAEDEVDAARYVLCATLDAAVASAPWGPRGEWPPLLFLFHRAPGDTGRVVRYIEGVAGDPLASAGLQEIFYSCLSLGLDHESPLRRRLLERLRNRRGEPTEPLAMRWHPADVGRRWSAGAGADPRYLLIGAAGAGKSMLRAAWAHPGVREPRDEEEWSQLLRDLRERRMRAVEGVLLACSAASLVDPHDGACREALRRARGRLDTVSIALGRRMPVYVLVTGLDRLWGFHEHFGDLDATGRGQVLGVTFDIDDSRSGRAARTFPAEFDALAERMNRRIARRLWDEPGLRGRALAFEFPRQFAALRARAVDLVAEVSAGEQASLRPLLRGLYFTAVPRRIGRVDGLGGVAAAVPWPDGEVVPGDAGDGQSYFVASLLEDVILREAGIGRPRTRDLFGAIASRIRRLLSRRA